jgi:hypothetical protein
MMTAFQGPGSSSNSSYSLNVFGALPCVSLTPPRWYADDRVHIANRGIFPPPAFQCGLGLHMPYHPTPITPISGVHHPRSRAMVWDRVNASASS